LNYQPAREWWNAENTAVLLFTQAIKTITGAVFIVQGFVILHFGTQLEELLQ
jgi:hypothetical protein